ncbi:MAG TPA: branched-chain amino acid ABC transporter ATP-binding protein/permease [Candidatus Acidoferrum sp.]|nr:branched-chain amino acid ABC transporter ATP-binding protein/permease [Candidatus Acidoferrum sp.]
MTETARAKAQTGSAIRSLLGQTTDVQRRRAILTVVTLLLVAFPLIDRNGGDIDAAANACAFAILALGLNIVVGYAGLLDLGYAAFFAIGAYTYGALASWQVQPLWSDLWTPFQWLGLVDRFHAEGAPDVVHFTFSFWIGMPVAAIVAAFFGVLFGAPTLRLRGDYLAIVTLGFGEIVPIVARNWPTVTNGAIGLNGVQAPRLFGYSFGVDSEPFYYLGLLMIAAMILLSLRLQNSRIGRAWMAIREDEIAASAMGINLVSLKLLAFGIGAAFGGMTGAFYVSKLQTATPDMFMFPVSVMILVMVVLGGMGSVYGVVLAAIILQLLQSWFLQDLTGWIHKLGSWLDSAWLQRVDLVQSIELIFGIILVTMMLFRRQGLIPATRATPALTLDQQTAHASRGGFASPIRGIEPSKAAPAQPMIEVRNLTRRYGGIVAVKDLNIIVESNSIVALIGPNGSGKSTTFNLITGMDEPSSGQVLLLGEDITGLKAHAITGRGIARTFQNLRLFSNMTVLENVLVAMHSRTTTGPLAAALRTPSSRAQEREAQERAFEIIGAFGNRLLPRTNQLVKELSYANRRRVEIARALASRPKVLLLDEPTAGMNPVETLELSDQIRSLRNMGLTVFLIEHKLNVVNDIADKIIVLDHGEKIAEGTAEQVHSNPQVLEAYLGRKAAHA